MKRLIVAATPRTGSELLCSLLEETGGFGRPREYVNPRYQEWARSRIQTESAHFREWWDGAYRVDGVDALKTMWTDFERATEGLDLETRGRVCDSHWVFMRRRDRMAQAVSLLKSKLTGLWHRGPERPREDIAYLDFYSLGGMLREIEREEAGWLHFFADNRIRPVEIFYEDPGCWIRQVQSFCGLLCEAAVVAELGDSRVKQTSSAQNAELVELGNLCFGGNLLSADNPDPSHPLVCTYPIWLESTELRYLSEAEVEIGFSVTNHGSEPIVLSRQLFQREQRIAVGLQWARMEIPYEKWIEGVSRLPPQLGPGQRHSGLIRTSRPASRDHHEAYLLFLLDLGTYHARMMGGNAVQLKAIAVAGGRGCVPGRRQGDPNDCHRT